MAKGGETTVMFTMPPAEKSHLVLAPVTCKNRVIEAVVDTSAGVTVISPELCKTLGLPLHKKWEGPLLLMANGSVTHPESSVSLEILVDGVQIYVEAAVLTLNGIKLLLGNNALRQLDSIQIDYLTGGGAIFSSKPESESVKKEPKLGSLTNRQAITAPALSIITVSVDVAYAGGTPGEQYRLVEPSNKVLIDKGLSIGNLLLSETTSATLEVQLVNFSRVDQWLNKGTVLGCILPASEVKDSSTPVESTDQPAVGDNATLDFDKAVNGELPRSERWEGIQLLTKYVDCFATNGGKLGQSTLVQHKIDTGEHPPIHQAPYRTAWKEREIEQEQIRDMKKRQVIEPSSSAWAAPVVLVKKKDGTWRFCVDYRKLNAITTRDVYPLPRIEDALSRLEGCRYFTIMDLEAGYWQVGVREEDREKTAFITADGLYQFRVMPFGLTNAPATFQRMMDILLSGLKWVTCLVYLDDIVVFSTTFAEHLPRLEAVLMRIRGAGLKIKLSKCSFFATCLKVLGYVVSGEGLSPDPSKLLAVRKFPVPKSVKDVQSFIGLCSYYRRFIPDFATLAKPLTDMTKKGQVFAWAGEHQASFQRLQQALQQAPVLGHPNYQLPMEIHCDASGFGLGAILIQRQEGGERVIAYASRLLDKAETNYSISEKECLALVFAVQRFRCYVWGVKIRVVTDHHALCWLMKKKNLAGRLARWSLQLQDMDIEIVHRSGRLHTDADALSRNPVEPPEGVDDIPTLTLAPINQRAIFTEQRASSWWKEIIDQLQRGGRSRRDRRQTRGYELIDGILYHRMILHGRAYYRLCLPHNMVHQVMLACHDDMTAGHMGITRTLDKIQKRYHWPKMTKQITTYVRGCIDCQTKKRPMERPAGLMKPIKAQQPFERVGIDLIGPFPLSRSGNKHVIIAVDYLTKWVIAQPVSRARTQEVVEFFVRRVVLQHGAPVYLISDRGKCLTSKFAEELYKALQTNHLVTAAYHPQSNGLVERFNHTFAEMLSMYVSSCHDDWDEVVDFMVFSYNTSRQESTGVTPFFLLYGREAVLPVDVALGSNPNFTDGKNPRPLATRLAEIRESVKRRLIVVQAKQKERYDRRRCTVSYTPGNLVWVFRPARKKGRSQKLLHPYSGPYKIMKRLNDLNYLVSRPGGKRKVSESVHVSNLKKYHKQAKVLTSAPNHPPPTRDQVDRSKQQATASPELSSRQVRRATRQTSGHSVQQDDDCAARRGDDHAVRRNDDCAAQRSDEHAVRPDDDCAAQLGDDRAAQRSDVHRIQSDNGTTETADHQSDVRSVQQSKGSAVFSHDRQRKTRQNQAFPISVGRSRRHVLRPEALLKPPDFLTYQ